MALSVSVFSIPAQAGELKMLQSWNDNYVGTVEIAQRFVANVASASGGAMTISAQGPATVPPFEQYEPVVAGVFDLLFTHGAYHFGETSVGMAIDALSATPGEIRSSGIWKYVDQYYQKRGLKLISLPTSGAGYHIVLREPVGSSGDLEGRKIRGTPVYLGLLSALKASAVVLPGGQIYSALEKGVIDGAAWPAIGTLDFKWNEVAKYFLRPTFGRVTHLVLMNLDKWSSLSASDQQFLMEQGKRLEDEVYARFDELADAEIIALKGAGMSETNLSSDITAKLGKIWADGVWAVATKKSGADVTNLRKLAVSAGLAD